MNHRTRFRHCRARRRERRRTVYGEINVKQTPALNRLTDSLDVHLDDETKGILTRIAEALETTDATGHSVGIADVVGASDASR